MSLLSSQSAHRQYASRPADESFPSLDALVSAALTEKNLSAERTYNLKDLRVEPIGETDSIARGTDDLQLVSPKGAARFTHWSFGQLARSLGAPAGYLRDELSPALAADCLNYGLSHSEPGTSANLLVRGSNGQPPIVRAATSDSYGRCWDADLYGALANTLNRHDQTWSLPPTWSGEPKGAYRGDRDSFLILTNGGSIVSDPTLRDSGNGQMYRGILIRNSEVGASSVTIETILYRYVCGNHMLWGAVIDRAFRRRHAGNNVTRDTLREIGKIAYSWANASTDRDNALIAMLTANDIATTKEAVIDELRAMGATKEQAENAYATCERTETVSPRTFWGMAQGLTRDSQATMYQDERYQLDKLAGQVLARGARVKVAA